RRLLLHTAPEAREAMARHEVLEAHLAHLAANPVRDRGAGDGPRRREQRIDPEEHAAARGQVDYERVDAEGKEEHHGRIKCRKEVRAPPREEETKGRMKDAHRALPADAIVLRLQRGKIDRDPYQGDDHLIGTATRDR